MKQIGYLYHWMKNLNPRDSDLEMAIKFSALAALVIMPLVMIMDNLFDCHLFHMLFSPGREIENVLLRRLFIGIKISWIFVCMYIFIKSNKIFLEKRYTELSLDTSDKRKKARRYIYMHFIYTGMFFIAGLTSTSWVPMLKSIFK